jgi:hypothetical protein
VQHEAFRIQQGGDRPAPGEDHRGTWQERHRRAIPAGRRTPHRHGSRTHVHEASGRRDEATGGHRGCDIRAPSRRCGTGAAGGRIDRAQRRARTHACDRSDRTGARRCAAARRSGRTSGQ